MTARDRPRFVIAGLATCAAGIFGAPWFLIEYRFLADTIGPLGVDLFKLADPLLLGYAAFEFRRLVGAEGQFNRLLVVFILIEAAQAALAGLALAGVNLDDLLGLRIILVVALGINLVWLGAALLSMKPNHFHLMKPLGLLAMVTGFMVSALIWLPLALVPAALAKLVAAAAFFRAASLRPRDPPGNRAPRR